jgi:hypothetical protein
MERGTLLGRLSWQLGEVVATLSYQQHLVLSYSL